MTQQQEKPLSPPGAERVVDETGGRATAGAFAVLSAVRRARIVHPDGVAAQAAWDTTPYAVARDDDERGAWGARLLDAPARRRALVRVSRGAGLPEGAPDVMGLAVRVLDAAGPGRPQDLLLTCVASDRPVLRHVLWPSRRHGELFYSSVLPYRTGSGRLVMFGARAIIPDGASAPTRLVEVAGALAAGTLRFELLAASPGGDWSPVALVDTGQALTPPEAEGLGFNPYRGADDLQPAGWLNALRRRAYAASQAGRDATTG